MMGEDHPDNIGWIEEVDGHERRVRAHALPLSSTAGPHAMDSTPSYATLGGWPTVRNCPKRGDFCTVPEEKMLSLSKMYLFVHCWDGGRRAKPPAIARRCFSIGAFDANGLVLVRDHPPLSRIPML
jgi:hypothetical protein